MPLETTNNISQVLASLDRAMESALDEIGSKAVGYAKTNVHVITGNLRESIGYTSDKKEAIIYASASYAADEELGNSHQNAHPYLLPSVTDHLSEYANIVEAKARGAM